MKLELEYAYRQSVLAGLAKQKVNIESYVPQYRQMPTRALPVESAWQGIESILQEMIERFDLRTDRRLEFGVD